ncbi:helix-turn-helix domain-containing protein, partial [Sneathia sp. DSM 16630]|nr:helix-turn-helix domain-containing protein [Sneathia sp. DSM 16630]
KIQNTSLDRTNYIISKLITNEYIKIDDLSYELDISNRTISSDIKSIKQNLKKYKLDLKSTPYYGLSICGEEIDIRRYIVRF